MVERPSGLSGGRGLPRVLVPPVCVLVNAIAFCLVRPGVPDLWAARARASAAAHGVGLTYWFSWFGGSTPGDYSVLTPFLCALVGTELVAALAAVAISGVAAFLVRHTHHPTAASWVVTVGVVTNLWCGRVPFLLGAALAAGSVAMVSTRRTRWAAPLAVLSVLGSPVAGAFLAVALSGVVVSHRLRAYRTSAVVVIAGAVGSLALIAFLFGSPGPEPFPPYLLAESCLALLLMLVLAPTPFLRGTLVVSAVVALVVFAIPNGLGANFTRLVLFCLPGAAVALSRRRLLSVVALTAPIVVLGGLGSVSAAISAAQPASQASYYAPLAAELDARHHLFGHRLELVAAGRAAYAALLDHAMLARGWETQSFLSLDPQLASGALTPAEYRSWLDDNAVAYVAVDTTRAETAESRLIGTGDLPYLRQAWSDGVWRLYEVVRPAPIVAAPGRLEAWSQAAMRIHVRCACRTLLRIRWSAYLTASPVLADGSGDDAEDAFRPTLSEAPSGWTSLTTNKPGTYLLDGLL
jgi:hypothetical protein